MARSPELNYCPSCACALETRQAFGRARRYCPACDTIVFREHKVAAGVIVERDGQVLLVRRRLAPRRGLWTFPGGFVDYRETPIHAAVRECREETGLEVEVTDLVAVVSGEERDGGADIVIVYHGRALDGVPQSADDVDRARFFDPDDLPPLAFEATRQALEQWRASR